MTTSPFPSALLEVRTTLGLDQTEFGTLVHVSARTVSRWETGQRVPPVAQQRTLVAALARRELEAARRFGERVGVRVERVTGAGRSPEQDRATVEATLLAAAEELDLSPKPLRRVLVSVLK